MEMIPDGAIIKIHAQKASLFLVMKPDGNSLDPQGAGYQLRHIPGEYDHFAIDGGLGRGEFSEKLSVHLKSRIQGFQFRIGCFLFRDVPPDRGNQRPSPEVDRPERQDDIPQGAVLVTMTGYEVGRHTCGSGFSVRANLLRGMLCLNIHHGQP